MIFNEATHVHPETSIEEGVDAVEHAPAEFRGFKYRAPDTGAPRLGFYNPKANVFVATTVVRQISGGYKLADALTVFKPTGGVNYVRGLMP